MYFLKNIKSFMRNLCKADGIKSNVDNQLKSDMPFLGANKSNKNPKPVYG